MTHERAVSESVFADVDERQVYVEKAQQIVAWYRGGQKLSEAPKWLAKWPPNGIFAARLLAALVEENAELAEGLDGG